MPEDFIPQERFIPVAECEKGPNRDYLMVNLGAPNSTYYVSIDDYYDFVEKKIPLKRAYKYSRVLDNEIILAYEVTEKETLMQIVLRLSKELKQKS